MQPLIAFADARTVPWANGLGRTTELVSWAGSLALSGPDEPPWRLSIAELAGPAPFSPLPGVRRQFLPVGGSVTLTVDGAVRRVGPGTVTTFAGDDDVELVELADGPCHAINLMVRADPRHHGPALRVGDVADAAGFLVAVALRTAAGVERFDLFGPGEPLATSLPVALVGPAQQVPTR